VGRLLMPRGFGRATAVEESGPLDIMLVTEGTYPQVHGGVSTWCDQMIKGLSGHRFQVVSLTATGREAAVWKLPENVLGHDAVPIWSLSAPSRGRDERTEERRSPRRIILSPRRRADARAESGHAPARALVAAVLSNAASAPAEFEAALFELFLLAQRMSLGPVWRTARLVRDVVELWGEYQREQGHYVGRELPLSDAIATLDLIEHALRPLAYQPARTDLTHTVSNGLAAMVGMAAKWAHGTPFILAEHGVYLRERYLALRLEPLGWPVKAIMAGFTRRLCEAGYRAADLITPCADFNQRWERRLGAEPAKLRTVYNGVDPDRFREAGPEPEQPTLAFVGRIDPLKDVLTLLRAFALVLERIPEARLRIYGAAPKGGEEYEAQCRALVADLGVAHAVSFEGQCDAVAEAYAASHVVVLSSISEGFPFSVIEAMVCGRTLVATEVGGVAEAIGPTGVVVPPRRPGLFAEACIELLTDHARRRALGRAARERALALFTFQRAVDAFDQIYRELAVEPKEALPSAEQPSAEQSSADQSSAERATPRQPVPLEVCQAAR
jgi:polysaccharide biosynthesis protein PelF